MVFYTLPHIYNIDIIITGVRYVCGKTAYSARWSHVQKQKITFIIANMNLPQCPCFACPSPVELHLGMLGDPEVCSSSCAHIFSVV